MKKMNLKNVNNLEILSREELKIISGGAAVVFSDGGCCLYQFWAQTAQFTETCNISPESAHYACTTRKQTNPDYSCHVTC